MIRRTAAAMAMLGFALGALLGAVGGCSLERALTQAFLAMLGFFVVGLGVGAGFHHLLREHFAGLAGREEGAHGPAEDRKPAGPTA